MLVCICVFLCTAHVFICRNIAPEFAVGLRGQSGLGRMPDESCMLCCVVA